MQTKSRWPYLDGGDVKRRGDAEDGHDDRLVLLVDKDLHVSDVLFSRHLGAVLVRYVGFAGPGWGQVGEGINIAYC